MDAEAAVHRRAVDAEEDAVGDGRPGWVLGVAIEAHLHARTTVRTGNCTEENKNHACSRADTDRKCCRQHRGTYPPGVLDVLGAVRGGWWVGAVAGVVAGGRGGGGRRRALGIRVSRGCRGPPVLEDSAAAARPAAVGEGVRRRPRPGGAGRAVGCGGKLAAGSGGYLPLC